MSLKYTCPSCGTPLGYEGLCWKCKSEQERKAALAWTPEQITEKQRNLIQNIQRLADMEDPEFTDFWQLLGYHDAITPEIQRAALAAEVFWPCEIYYHAPADVRDGLIHALLSAEYSSAASNLMSCLAMQGDDKAMETLLELERNPRPWRKGLYVDPSSYAQIGGWTFNKEGQKIQLNFDTCYPMDRCDDEHSSLQEKFIHTFFKQYGFTAQSLPVLVHGVQSMQNLESAKEFCTLIANKESLDAQLEIKGQLEYYLSEESGSNKRALDYLWRDVLWAIWGTASENGGSKVIKSAPKELKEKYQQVFA